MQLHSLKVIIIEIFRNIKKIIKICLVNNNNRLNKAKTKTARFDTADIIQNQEIMSLSLQELLNCTLGNVTNIVTLIFYTYRLHGEF